MAQDGDQFPGHIYAQSPLLHLLNFTVCSTTFATYQDRKATEILTVQPVWPRQPHFA